MQKAKPDGDSAHRAALREARTILIACGVLLVWIVGYSVLFGYEPPEGAVPTVLGIPAWVFWGVVLPWLGATVFCVWFALFRMTDEEPTEGDSAEQDDA